MRRNQLMTAVMFVLAAALFVVACNDAPSPTAPPLPTEGSTAAPGSANLDAVQPTARGGQPKVDVCHQEGNGGYHIINVAEPAVPAHEAHGDWLVGPEICDGVDNNCDGEVDEGGVCAACPCWDEPELLSCTAGNGFCGGGGSSNFVVIQNTPGSTPGVEGGFAVVFGLPRCLTRDFPPGSLTITAAEAEACADQIRSRCAAIGQPLPLSGLAATEGGTPGGFPGWE